MQLTINKIIIMDNILNLHSELMELQYRDYNHDRARAIDDLERYFITLTEKTIIVYKAEMLQLETELNYRK